MIESFADKHKFNELRIMTRKQLLKYPEFDMKMQMKSLIKSFILEGHSISVDHFAWPNGLLATSLEWCHRVTKNDNDLEYLKKYYDGWIQKGASIQYIDHLINGYSLIYLYQLTNDEKYKTLLNNLYKFLLNYPKTIDGSLPYRKGNGGIVLVDGIGMVCPFLCRYGNTFNDPQASEIAITQLLNFISNGLDGSNYLPYHGYESTTKRKVGIVGWGRGVGWLLIGMVDSLEYISKSNPSYEPILNCYVEIVKNVINLQRREGDYSWQVTAVDGYSDSSSTSMITYAIKRGVMLGILDDSYLSIVNFAIKSLNNSTVDGLVIDCSAECRGISMYPQNYGAYPWAQGPTTALYAISSDIY